jgi:hypothetical protein
MTEYWCAELRWNWIEGRMDLYCRKQYELREIDDFRCKMGIKGGRTYCLNEEFIALLDETPTFDEVEKEVLRMRKLGRFPDSDDLIEKIIKAKQSEKQLR